MKATLWTFCVILILTITACHNNEDHTEYFDKSGMDTTIRPGENFFLYANGKWLKHVKIPAAETGWGTAYILRDKNEAHIHTILNYAAAHDDSTGSINQKVGDMFKSGMDTVAIEKLGYDPVKPQLAEIAAVKDYKQLVKIAADGFKTGDGFLFGFYVSPDDKISTKNAAHFDQSGLTLPNRDYYFKTDSASKKILNGYLKYIAKLFTLTGANVATATKKAGNVLKLETAMAEANFSPVELRDPVKNYNKFSFAGFQKQMPDVDLKDAFKRMALNADTVLVGQPRYYSALNGLLTAQPIQVWKDKATFDALNGAAPYLAKSFRNAHFDFYGTVLNGQKKERERWKLMAEEIDNGLGELLGQLYVAKYFPPDAKQRMLDLVNNLQAVYKQRIEKLDWMSAETKKRAVAKLDAFTKKIGYPDKWKNYDDIQISKDAFYNNEQAIEAHNYREMIKKVGKPVDRTEWDMTPPTINAYNNPVFNEIVFPAGILQFPFFDKDADDAINYGAIGVVIGHEMTHGFDDQGRQYDKDGNLKDWWTPQDADKFKAKVKILINQYNQFTVLDNLHLNGELTQGENLADIGGVMIAYQAFKNTPEGKSDVKIGGFTPDQRFFLSLTQLMQNKSRDESVRMRVSNDPHSPPMYRVNGPFSNMPEFYKAFNIKPGDKMYRPDSLRVKVW